MPYDLRGMHIIPARNESLAGINALIAGSKAYWDWPSEYLEKALALHVVDSAYLRAHYCFEALGAQQELVAFYSVVVSESRVVLDNLWVSPDLIGSGIGRRLCVHLFRLAREQRWCELWVVPDPPAEGFYLKAGFSDTGERVPSRVRGGPVFSVYQIQLPAESG
jgi:GNAT superfamily N-acetyltransferase